MTHTQAWEIH